MFAPRVASLLLLALVGPAVLPRPAHAQSTRFAFEGFVLDPDGLPVEGAVVVTSAGGRAVTDAAGSYRLEVVVPDEATSAELTAVGGTGGRLVAHASVPLRGAHGVTARRVGVLQLGGEVPCSPNWLPTFGGHPGTHFVYCMAVFDDGTGPALHAGGAFASAGGGPANDVARWDGTEWTPLGSGLDYVANAMTVFDDGTGPALYVGGAFSTAGGVAASHVARWDGASWSALGSGVDDVVHALTSYDDGDGPALYAGGSFRQAGGLQADYVARWDGTSWAALDGHLNGFVKALVVHDEGGGPALYVGGQFTTTGTVAATRVARWDGTSWSGLGGAGPNDLVEALASYDDGGGPALCVGGRFTQIGAVPASYVGKWDGTSWSALGSGMSYDVQSLAVHDAGSGPALYAGGAFLEAGGQEAAQIARWNGTVWLPLGNGTSDDVRSLLVFDEGEGPRLFAGGTFEAAGGHTANGIARWDGADWSAVGGRGMDGPVHALALHDDGSGQALFAGGGFLTAGGVPTTRVGRWDGTSWSALGSGTNDDVYALAAHDDGGGTALYAGGLFTEAGGAPASHVARWDGTSWSALDGGTDDTVLALATFDDGTGPALYAGGLFAEAGGAPASHVARWDGSSWSPLGSGTDGGVAVLAVYDDGSGPALYAGGYFDAAGGVPASRIAHWDGSTWSPLGSGVDFGLGVAALAVHDDGRGPVLYAGGNFQLAGGEFADSIARWDGASWSSPGFGTNFDVLALASFDDGRGPALYAGGMFTTAGGVAVNRIARWDGSSWSALGSGVDAMVRALAVQADEEGAFLLVGGSFGVAYDSADSFVARWGCFQSESCVRTRGYLGTHACDWPPPFQPGAAPGTDADGDGIPDGVEGQCGVRPGVRASQCPCDTLHTIPIGSIPYDQCELLCALEQPVSGNALRFLAHHLIGAKLNVLAGAGSTGTVFASCAGLPPNPYDGFTAADLIAAGDTLIATGTTDGFGAFTCAGSAACPCPSFPANVLTDCVRGTPAGGNTLGPAMTAVGELLKLYNLGCGGVPSCTSGPNLAHEASPVPR